MACDDGEQQQQDAVVRQLRDRIRSQAMDLLNRVDESQSRKPPTSRQEDEEEQKDVGNEEKKKDDRSSAFGGGSSSNMMPTPAERRGSSSSSDSSSSSSSSSSSTDANRAEEEDDEDEEDSSSSGAAAAASQRRRGSALTQRLQKLALDRQMQQDQGFGSQRQRLRVIQADSNNSHLASKSCSSFQELQLPDHLLKALFEMGLDRPSAIQEAALPRILAGRNLLGQAQSGSGKTLAFALGLLYRTKVDFPATTQGLVLCPTRELAIQAVEQALRPMAAHMKGLKIRLAISGEKIERGQRLDAHIIVGTPGKVVSWLKQRTLNPNTVKTFVLDEADTMVDVGGFRANSLLVKNRLPPKCQHLLFSATFPPLVVDFATKMVKDADQILIERDETLVVDVIKQLYIDTRSYPGGKILFLADIYNLMTIGQSIVFVETRDEADAIHSTLSNGGYSCSVLHSGLESTERDETMKDFRRGKSTVLITTNVLARGVDVDNVCLVINCHVQLDRDGQPDYETYLHRIGRTGRFGRKGTAVTLVSDDAGVEALRKIQHHFGRYDDDEAGNGGGAFVPMPIQQAAADPEGLAEVIEI